MAAWLGCEHGLKRGARDVSTAGKLKLQLDFSHTLIILARGGSSQKLLFKIYVYGIEPPRASRSIAFQAMVVKQVLKVNTRKLSLQADGPPGISHTSMDRQHGFS